QVLPARIDFQKDVLPLRCQSQIDRSIEQIESLHQGQKLGRDCVVELVRPERDGVVESPVEGGRANLGVDLGAEDLRAHNRDADVEAGIDAILKYRRTVGQHLEPLEVGGAQLLGGGEWAGGRAQTFVDQPSALGGEPPD